jgi:hypothetical protein
VIAVVALFLSLEIKQASCKRELQVIPAAVVAGPASCGDRTSQQAAVAGAASCEVSIAQHSSAGMTMHDTLQPQQHVQQEQQKKNKPGSSTAARYVSCNTELQV